MKIRYGKIIDWKDYWFTEKQAFPKSKIGRGKKFFGQKIKNKELFVLTEKGKYRGHLAFGSYPYNPPFEGSVFIEEFAVKEEFRSKGFGKLLIAHLVKYCKTKKIKEIWLGTSDNRINKAIKFYKRLGFTKRGWLKGEEDPKSEYYNESMFFYRLFVRNWKN